MKLISAVIKPFKLDEVKVAVKAAGVTGLTATQARGFGHTGGHIEIYRGKEYEFDFIEKIKIEVVVSDELVAPIVAAIAESARTDTVGDGIVWVTDVSEVVRIRTNERGEDAV